MRVIKIKPSPTTAPLFAQLKQGTASAHRALEATYPFNTMMKPGVFNKVTYGQNLLVLASFHRVVSDCFAASDSAFGELQPYLHSAEVNAALQADLQHLEISDAVPGFDATLSANNPADLLSAAYVWMGSSMGARILHKWLQKAGYTNLPCHYYAKMQLVGSHWPDFVSHAADLAQQHQVHAADCIDAANTLFSGLQNTARKYYPQTRSESLFTINQQ